MPGTLNPLSQRAWDAFRQRVTELGGVVLEPEWLGSHKPHRCRCINGHACQPRPGDATRYGICRVCARNDPDTARESFYQRVSELGGVVLEPGWLGNHKRHRCRCLNGHECSPQPSDVQQGHGICRVCARKDPAAAWANFRQRVAELGGVVLEPEWLGTMTPHRCRCVDGHECQPRPAQVQQGEGICRVCAGNDPAAAWANFRQRVAELGGIVLEPEWLGSDKLHRCRCINGHECSPRPASVRHQGICRTCVGQDSAVSWERFCQQVAELGGVVLEPEWLGKDKPHHCLCINGHECSPRPGNVRSGGGVCRVCSWRAQDALYVVRDPVRCHVKFGISNRDSRARMRKHRGNGFTEIVRLETGLPEYLAAHIEQKIMAALKMAGEKPVSGREYFSDDNIALIINEIDIWI